ncbi:AB hydrolase-1 domain-containing protein [Aphelenchoides besseyi]|nr:AB hydrolase-1 domain-containing protein [Aphelenchoides besseyi]
MFTAPILHLLVLLFCRYCECGKPKTTPVPLTIQSSNFTKRPLNLYITANGKHAVVEEKKVELANCAKLDRCTLTYKESVPPFLIKTRGSALLIYDVNSDYVNWHTTGRPSVVQELAASGHRTLAVGLEHLWKQGSTLNNFIDRTNLTNIVLIFPHLAYTDFELLNDLSQSQKLDGVVLISPTKIPPIVSKTIVIDEQKHDDFPLQPDAQEIVIKSPLKDGNQDNVMQIVTNFFDFIHPR